MKQFIRSMQENEKVLVFVGRKTTYAKSMALKRDDIVCIFLSSADDVASDFMLDGICCQCIHGDRYYV